MARNKMKRFLAGLCTAAMLLQTAGETGMAVMAADNEEVVTTVVSEDDAEEEDPVSADEAEESVSEDAVSENEADADSVSSDETGLTENDAENDNDTTDASEDEGKEESELDGLHPSVQITDGKVIFGGKVYGTFVNGVFTVSKDVREIDFGLFVDWAELTEIRFEEGAECTTIGTNTEGSNVEKSGAFMSCKNLTKVDMTNAHNLTAVFPYSFKDCGKLETVIFNQELQFIQRNAFEGCKSIEEIVFEKELLRIEQEAFLNCSKLHKVVVRNKNTKCVTYNGAAASRIFDGCAIDEFELDTLTEDGKALFPANLFYKATFKKDTTIVIPDHVLEITENAFRESNIAHVKLPKGLQTVGKSAFQKCQSLAEIDFSPCDSSTGITLEDYAFSECTSISELNLQPKDSAGQLIPFRKIGSQAFYKDKALVTLILPDTVAKELKIERTNTGDLKYTYGDDNQKTLGSSIFEGCTGIEEVKFPVGPKYVGDSMFKGCTSLTKIWFGYDHLDAKEDHPDKSEILMIGDGAFWGCQAILTDVRLPKKLQVLGARCFREAYLHGCADLSGLDDLIYIGDEAFYGNNYYSSVLPESLEHIGANAFNSCGFKGTLRIPKKINYIGASAFANVNRISWVVIAPEDIAFCGEKIFYENYVSGFSFEKEDGSQNRIPAGLFNQTTWVTQTPIVIPYYVKTIGKEAFKGGNGGNSGNYTFSFQAGSKIETIEQGAFMNCQALEAIELPDSLQTIGNYAFQNCTKLKQITIPEGVTTLGTGAFSGCSLLEVINFNAIAVSSKNDRIFEKCNIKFIYIGDKVTVFPDRLFSGAQFQKVSETSSELVEVRLEIPKSVTRFGDYCLTNVINLQEITFPNGSSLNSIGKYAFSGCKKLNIVLPDSVKIIDNFAFQNCEKLSGIKLPNGLETLGQAAFKGCVGIAEINIPSAITVINRELCSDCKQLSKLTFDGTAVTSIGDSAFKGCNISSVALPEGVKTIGTSAFSGNDALASVSIPKTLTQIGNSAFADCPIAGTIKLYEGFNNLGSEAFSAAGKTAATAVYLPETLKSIGKAAFNVAYKDNLSFYVVPGSYAEKWLKDNGFGDRIVGSSEAPKTYTVTFDLQGHGTAIPEVIVEKGNKVTKPADPSEDGWIFGGWFTEKACKTAFDFETEITKNVTIYAKWDKGAEDIKGGYSALDPVPEITAATTDLWLVKGQKFNIGEGWKVDKAFKKYVSISKKGSFKAKKETPDTVKVIISHEGRNDITVHICKPVIDKKLPLVIETADQVKSGKINLAKDANIKNVLWYSASPDVATVDKDGNVTAVAKGTAKVTAYVNGSAYTCSVTVKETVPALKRTMHINSGASKTIKIKGVKASWTSADDAIATVNKKGKVSAVAPGTTTLTATVGETTYSIVVYVEDINVSGDGVVAGKPNKYTINLKKGEGTTLKFSDSLEQDVVFKSSKPDIAFVDENGKVVARSKGSSSLTTKINGKKVTVTVKVTE